MTHVHYYFLSLLVSDLIQAIGELLCGCWLRKDLIDVLLLWLGGILNIKWIQEAVCLCPFGIMTTTLIGALQAVMEVTQCMVQGIFKQLGDVGVALA